MSVDLMRKYGINAPRGQVAKTPEEAYEIAKRLGNDIRYYVVIEYAGTDIGLCMKVPMTW